MELEPAKWVPSSISCSSANPSSNSRRGANPRNFARQDGRLNAFSKDRTFNRLPDFRQRLLRRLAGRQLQTEATIAGLIVQSHDVSWPGVSTPGLTCVLLLSSKFFRVREKKATHRDPPASPAGA